MRPTNRKVDAHETIPTAVSLPPHGTCSGGDATVCLSMLIGWTGHIDTTIPMHKPAMVLYTLPNLRSPMPRPTALRQGLCAWSSWRWPAGAFPWSSSHLHRPKHVKLGGVPAETFLPRSWGRVCH